MPDTMTQRTLKKSKLERDLERKPKITLKQLKKTAVNTLTQEEYTILMRVYECGKWRWSSGGLPTHSNNWNIYKKEICMEIKNGFGYSNEEYLRKEGYEIISTQKFYDKQKITPENIAEINNYFETTFSR